MKHSSLVQIQSNDIENAPTILSGEQDHLGQIALAMVPEEFTGCCKLRVLIPQGVTAVVQNWGRQEEQPTPAGPHWCWPFYKYIAYIVTIKNIQYNAPVRRVPTKDNVRIDIDMDFRFSIGPSLQEVAQFVYNLGIARFDEMLTSLCEEQIRNFVLEVDYNRARDLSSVWATEILKNLNTRFLPFGVKFNSCNITEVRLPPASSQVMTQIADIKSQIRYEMQRYETEKNDVNNRQQQLNQQQERDHERRLDEINATCRRKENEKEVWIAKATTDLEVATTQAQEKAEKIVGEARNQKELAKKNAERQANQMVLEAQAKANQIKIQAQQKAGVDIQMSKAQLKDAENSALARIEEGKAEGQAAQALKVRREYEISLEKAKVLQTLARNGKFILSGSSAEQMMDKVLGRPTMK